MASFPDEETAMRLASEQDRAPRLGTPTPTPWHYDHLAIFAGDGVITRIPNHPDNGVNWDTDAAFIVKAVNNHDVLVKALRDLTNDVRGIWDTFEYSIREEVSNTNYAVVCDKLEEAYRVLSLVGGNRNG